MLKSSLLFSVILCLAVKTSQAQTGVVKIDTLLIGTWNGTSLCQIKNSPCHNETVVYHISKKRGVDTFFVNANKIINGVEEEMGVLPFIYNKKSNQFTSHAYGIWTFIIAGNKLEGTLYHNGDLYRKIKVYKHY